MPIIYIIDLDNARTLQGNISKKAQFTHRHLIRKIKQDIDCSIANHLEFLTSQWPHEEDLSAHTLNKYRRGEELCQHWVNLQANQNNIINRGNAEDKDHDSTQKNEDEDICSSTGNNRYHFDNTMYDALGRLNIVKVYSHQLDDDSSIKEANKSPAPNMFAATANQIADNAASYAQRLYSSNNNRIPDRSFYLPFSPDLCFSIERVLTNKGATNYFYQRLDEELLLRLQHRPKHGLFAGLASHQCLSSEYIRDESLYNGLIKMTATCWTRSIYLIPTLAEQSWKHWKYNLQDEILAINTPDNIPKGWKKNPRICNNIVKACPFCDQNPWIRKKIGNLEHLHLYCTSDILQNNRNHCYQKIEDAIGNLYSFAAHHEYNCDLQDTTRYTRLQEKMFEAA